MGDLGLPGLPGPKVLCLGWGFLDSPVQTGGRDFAWGSHLAQEWRGGCCSLCSSQISATAQRCMELLTPQRMLTGLLPPCLGFAPGAATSGCGQESQGDMFQDTKESLLEGCPHSTGKYPILSSVYHSLLSVCSSFFPPCIPKGGNKGLLGAP